MFDQTHCSSFLKPKFKEVNIKNGVPRNFLIDSYIDFFVVNQKYFTCEGRFNLVVLYDAFHRKRSHKNPFLAVATPIHTSPPIQAPTLTHTPQPVSKTPEVVSKTYPSMSKGNRKEVKTYLRKKNKLKVIQEEQ
jgi:hypothetical protein